MNLGMFDQREKGKLLRNLERSIKQEGCQRCKSSAYKVEEVEVVEDYETKERRDYGCS